VADRPDLEYIRALAKWTGGSLTELPYSTGRTEVLTDNGAKASGIMTPGITVTAAGFWGPFWAKAARNMAFHRREIQSLIMGHPDAPTFPQGFLPLVPPTCASKCKQARDQVFVGDPLITVECPGMSGESRKETEQKLSAYLQFRLRQEEQTSDVSPLEEQKAAVINYGLGVRIGVINMERWDMIGEQSSGESAADYAQRVENHRRQCSVFDIRTISPLNIAYDRSNPTLGWAIIREPIAPWEAKRAYPHLEIASNLPVTGTKILVKTQFWTPEWYACYVDGKPALTAADGADGEGVAPNPYGSIPVWPAGGGEGEVDPDNRPEYELDGIITNAEDALLEYAVLKNIQMMYSRRAGAGPKEIIRGPGGADTPEKIALAREVMSGPSKAVRVPEGHLVEAQNPSPFPEVLARQMERVLADIDETMSFSIAAGNPNPGQSGVSRQLVLGQLSKRVSTAVLHLQQSLERWARWELETIRDVLKEPVWATLPEETGVQAYELSPGSIPAVFNVRVDLLVESEAEKARLKQEGMELRKDGLIDDMTFWTDYAKEPHPERIRRGLADDALWKQVTLPMMLQVAQGQAPAIVAQAAQKAGITFTIQELAAAAASTAGTPAQAAQQAAPAGGGQLQVGPTGTILPGEAHNPANDAQLTPERAAMEQKQQLNGGTTRPRPKLRAVPA